MTTAANSSCAIEGSCGVQSLEVDQTVRPEDVEDSFFDGGSDWVHLFHRVTVGEDQSLKLTVNNSATGNVYIDAIRLEPLDAEFLKPASDLQIVAMSLLDAGNSLTASTLDPFDGEVMFGATQLGVGVEQTLRLYNNGLADLSILDVPTVTSGFTLQSPTSGYPHVISPDAWLDVTIQFDALTLGSAIGSVSVSTDNEVYPAVSIDLLGEVRQEWILDNGDRYGNKPDGYSETDEDGNEIKFSRRRRSTANGSTYSLTQGRGTGSQATWQIDDLEKGWYAVYSSWFGSNTHSTKAQYEVSTGDESITKLIDQTQSPDDLQSERAPWGLLSHVYVEDGTVTVSLTDIDDRKRVVSDAIRVQRIHQPRVSARHDGSVLFEGSVIDFGLTEEGTTTDETLQLSNDSELPLLVESIMTVPAGFAVIDFTPTYLAPSETLDVMLRQTAAVVGSFEGSLEIATSDSQNPVLDFTLKGEVESDALVLDDRDERFEKTGMLISWTNNRRGWHENTSRLAPTNRVATTGAWLVEGLDAGVYNIGVTWVPYSRTATNVPLTVSSGDNQRIGYVNQQVFPATYSSSYFDRGSEWIDAVVDFQYTDATVPLRVEMSNIGINGKRMIIDAIRIERVDDDASIPVFSSPGDAMVVLNHNDALAEDTNLDGTVTALDALVVLNDISLGVVSGESVSLESGEIRLTDVNADGQVTALDALTVLNAISRSSVLEGEASVLGPDVFGPDVFGPDVFGPDVFGPEELRLGASVLPGGSVADEDEYWARCLEEIDWDAEEDAMMDLGASSGSDLDPSSSTSLDASTTDAVFGSDRTGRPANALAEDRLDEFFSGLDKELAEKA